tara:strand:+ start:1041 stop:1184 length:144 start_codon:yes stop_codon:yes gene_type:complete
MALLKDVLHFTMMIFGAVVLLDNMKYPKLYMLINKMVFVTSLIYTMI